MVSMAVVRTFFTVIKGAPGGAPAVARADPSPRPTGDLRVARRLVQHPPPTLHIGLPQPRRVRGHRVHQHEPQGSLNQLNDPVSQIGSAPGRENGTWGYRRISGVLWSRR